MLDYVLREESLEKINYKDLKLEIITKIYEKYEYSNRKKIYRWSVPIIVDYLIINTDFKVGDELFDNIRSYLQEKLGKEIGTAINYIKTIIKVCIFWLHFNKIINLDYTDIEVASGSSTVLRDYYERMLNVKINKEDYKGIRIDMLLVIMMKNRITKIEQLNNNVIREYKEYLCSKESQKISHKRAIYSVENKLFRKGILEENAKFTAGSKQGIEEYYSFIKNQNIKNAIIWYIENSPSRLSIKKFHPHLLHFGKFIDENFSNISIDYYNCVISEAYNTKLEKDISSGEISSKNWASNCIIRINAFMNFLIDSQYVLHPHNRDIFLPNIFSERDKMMSNRREAIPEYIVSRIKENMLQLDIKEQAILSVYLDTGIRLNEFPLISISDIHGNAKELISGKNHEIEEGIGWIKVVSPKILYNERVVLISEQTYKALMVLKEERDKRFGNIPAQCHPKYPELGKRDFLILNIYGSPFSKLDWKIGEIIKKLNIKNDNGSDFKLTAHKFRHTFLTDLVRSGVPIYVAMDLMGHVSPAMTQYYDHFENDNQDIITKHKIINEQTQIIVSEANNIIISGEQINKLHEINYRYIKRGGYCSQDEFQEDCSNIDCIECPSNIFKTNYSFFDELRKSMISYLEQWANEPHEKSDKAIHFLYLSRLYENLLEKVEENAQEKEVTLTKFEMSIIAKEVGLE